MRNRTVSLLVSLLCFILALGAVRASLAQIKKPKAVSSPAQPTTSSEGAPKISKPSAAPAPAKGVEPHTDASSAPSPPTPSVTLPPPIQTSGSATPTSISGIAGSYLVQGTQAMVVVSPVDFRSTTLPADYRPPTPWTTQLYAWLRTELGTLPLAPLPAVSHP